MINEIQIPQSFEDIALAKGRMLALSPIQMGAYMMGSRDAYRHLNSKPMTNKAEIPIPVEIANQIEAEATEACTYKSRASRSAFKVGFSIASMRGYRRHLNSKPSGLKVGDKVVLDVEHNNSSVVTIRAMAKYYSTVTDGNCTWQVMTNRLSAIVSAASTPTLLEEKEDMGIAPILKLSEWLNRKMIWQESHAHTTNPAFNDGLSTGYKSVADEILRLTSSTVEPGNNNDKK